MKIESCSLYQIFGVVTLAALLIFPLEDAEGQRPSEEKPPENDAADVGKNAKEEALKILAAADKIAICIPMPPVGHIVGKALKGDVKTGTPWNDISFPKKQVLAWKKIDVAVGSGASPVASTGFYPLDDQGRVVIFPTGHVTLTPGEILTFLKVLETKKKAGTAPKKE